MSLKFRPIDQWPGELTPWSSRLYSRFKAHYSDTLDLLDRELWFLDAENDVLQLALGEHEIRLDGLPKASSKPSHPGVILAFDSKFGSLKYATDRFIEWKDNLRAIALSLEALRKVDRYGVSSRGEQYTGWRALGAGDSSSMSKADAQKFIIMNGGSYREAAKRLHPDGGGTSADFQKLQEAQRLIDDE